MFPALQANSLPTELSGKPHSKILIKIYLMLIIYSTPEITSLQFYIVKNFSHQLRDVLGILLLFTILLWSIKVYFKISKLETSLGSGASRSALT